MKLITHQKEIKEDSLMYGAQLEDLTLREGSVISVEDLNKMRLTGSYIIDSEFLYSNLEDTTLRRGGLYNTKFDHCRMMGSMYINTKLSNIEFYQCDLRESLIIDSKIDDVKFDFCDLSDSIFSHTNLSGTVFDRAIVSGADFRGSIMDEKTSFLDLNYDSDTKCDPGSKLDQYMRNNRSKICTVPTGNITGWGKYRR